MGPLVDDRPIRHVLFKGRCETVRLQISPLKTTRLATTKLVFKGAPIAIVSRLPHLILCGRANRRLKLQIRMSLLSSAAIPIQTFSRVE